MWLPTHTTLVMILLMFISISVPINAALSKKVDQILVPQASDTGIKCTACPCVNPCTQQFTPPPPPPPPPKIPSTQNCIPVAVAPPPPRFVYITGPPGSLYPLDPFYSDFYSGARPIHVVMELVFLFVFGVVLELLVLW